MNGRSLVNHPFCMGTSFVIDFRTACKRSPSKLDEFGRQAWTMRSTFNHKASFGDGKRDVYPMVFFFFLPQYNVICAVAQFVKRSRDHPRFGFCHIVIRDKVLVAGFLFGSLSSLGLSFLGYSCVLYCKHSIVYFVIQYYVLKHFRKLISCFIILKRVPDSYVSA